MLVTINHFVNSSTGAMNAIVFMALAGVLPIQQVKSLIVGTDKLNATKPGVFGFGEIRIVFPDKAVTFPFQSIAVDSQPMKIAG